MIIYKKKNNNKKISEEKNRVSVRWSPARDFFGVVCIKIHPIIVSRRSSRWGKMADFRECHGKLWKSVQNGGIF